MAAAVLEVGLSYLMVVAVGALAAGWVVAVRLAGRYADATAIRDTGMGAFAAVMRRLRLPIAGQLLVASAAIFLLPVAPKLARLAGAAPPPEAAGGGPPPAASVPGPVAPVPTPTNPRGEPLLYQIPPAGVRPELTSWAGENSPLAAALSPGGEFLAVGGEGKSVAVLDRRTGKPAAELTGHTDVVAGLAFSPDGKLLATASYDKLVKLWDVATWKVRRTLTGHGGWVLGVAFSPDGQLLATGSYDKTVRLWDVGTGGAKGAWADHSAGVRAIAFSPDGGQLVSGGSDRIARIWDVAGGTVARRLKGHGGAIRAVAFSPDGKTVATGSEDRTVKLWDPATGKERREFAGLPDMVSAVRFSPKGQTLVAGTFQGPVVVLDPVTGRSRQTLSGHADQVSAVLFGAGGALLTVSADRTVRRWDAVPPAAAAVQVLARPAGIVTAVAADPARPVAVLGGLDGSLAEWDLSSGRVVPLPPARPNPAGIAQLAVSAGGLVAAVGRDGTFSVRPLARGREGSWGGAGRHAAFSPDGGRLAVADRTDVVLYDAATGKEVRRLTGGHDGAVVQLAFGGNGKLLASAGNDARVRLWDAATGAVRQVSPPLPNSAAIAQVAFSPDGTKLAVSANSPDVPPAENRPGPGGRVRGVYVLNVPGPAQADWGGLPQPVTTADGAEVTAVAWAGTETLFAVTADGLARLWDVTTRKQVRTFRAHEAAALAVAPTGDGNGFITTGEDQAVRRWRVTAPSALAVSVRIRGPFGGSPVLVAGGDPGGRYLFASAAWDRKLQVFPRPPAPAAELDGEVGGARSVAYSPDGKWLVSGHRSGQIIRWDAATGKKVATLPELTQDVTGLCFSPDGKSLISVGGDHDRRDQPGEAVVWDTATWSPSHRLTGQGGPIWGAAVSPDGAAVAAACVDGTVRVWDLATGTPTRTLGKHGGGTRAVAYAPDGKTLISAGFDGTIRVWDAATGRQTRRITMPGARASSLAVSPDGRQVVATARPTDPANAKIATRLLSYWLDDPAAGPRELVGHAGVTLSVAFLKDGKTLVSGGGLSTGRGELLAWDFSAGKVLGEFLGSRVWVENLAAAPDGRAVATAGWAPGRPGEVRQWGAGGFRPAAAVPTIPATFLSCGAAAPDGRTLALGGGDGSVTTFDMTDPTRPVKRETVTGRHTTKVLSLTFDPAGTRFVTSDETGKVVVWDAGKAAVLKEWQAGQLMVFRARFTPDGKHLVTAAGNWKTPEVPGEMRVWDPRTGDEIARFPDQSSAVWDIDFLDGGKTLVSAQAMNGSPGEAPVKVWDFASRAEKRSVQVPGGMRCLAVSPDGQYLAVANHGGDVRLFRTADWEPLPPPPAHGRVVFRLQFRPDGRMLYSTSEDGTVGVTRIPVRE